MNQKNAKSEGRAEGKEYQRRERNLGNLLSKENYERRGIHLAQLLAARSKRTQALFIEGWNAVWEGDNS